MIVGIMVTVMLMQLVYGIVWLVGDGDFHWLWPVAFYEAIAERVEEHREADERARRKAEAREKEGTIRILEKDGIYTAEKFKAAAELWGPGHSWAPLYQYGLGAGSIYYSWGHPHYSEHGVDVVRRDSLEALQELVINIEKKPPEPNVVGEFKV